MDHSLLLDRTESVPDLPENHGQRGAEPRRDFFWRMIISLFWPVKIFNFRYPQHPDAFLMGMTYIIVFIWMPIGYFPKAYFLYSVIFYLGIVYAEYKGTNFEAIGQDNLPWAYLNHSCWDMQITEEERKKNGKSNLFNFFLIAISLVLWFIGSLLYFKFLNPEEDSFANIIDYSFGIYSLLLLLLINSRIMKVIIIAFNDKKTQIQEFENLNIGENQEFDSYFNAPNPEKGMNIIIKINENLNFWKEFASSLYSIEIAQTICFIYASLCLIFGWLPSNWELKVKILDIIELDDFQNWTMIAFFCLGIVLVAIKTRLSYSINEINHEIKSKTRKIFSQLNYLVKFPDLYLLKRGRDTRLRALKLEPQFFINVIGREQADVEEIDEQNKKIFIGFCNRLIRINNLVKIEYTKFYSKIEYKILGIFTISKEFFIKLFFGFLIPGTLLLVHLLTLYEEL